jgi:hypothetical protein
MNVRSCYYADQHKVTAAEVADIKSMVRRISVVRASCNELWEQFAVLTAKGAQPSCMVTCCLHVNNDCTVLLSN